MKKYIVLLAVLLMTTVSFATLTYDGTYYLKNQSTQYSGSTSNAIYLALEEIEALLGGGSSGVANIIFTPSSVPTPAEGMVYYDSAGNNLKLYTGAAWVDLDVAGASSLNTAYGIGSKISAGTLEVEIEVADSSNNPALRLDFNDATTNAQDVLVIDNAGDDSAAVSIQINGTAGYDIQGTGDTWNVDYTGVGTFVGLITGASDIVMENGDAIANSTDDFFIFNTNDKEDLTIDLAQTDILAFASTTGVVTVDWAALDSHVGFNAIAFDGAVANTITQTGTGGTDDLTISQATSGQDASLILQSSGTGTDALSLISSVADISLVSADNITRTAADNITDVTTDGGYTLTIGGATNGDLAVTVADDASVIAVGTLTLQNTEAASDITINSVLGSIYIEAEEDAANAILITADGSTLSTVKIHNDTGTDDESIYLASDVGGITLNAAAGSIDIEAVGGTAGDLTLSAGDIMTLTSADTKIFDGKAAETWIIEGTADDHEASIVFTDPTADVVYTFPVAAASTLSVMTSTLATNAPDIANSVTGGTSTLIFEGSAVDAHEHTITATNPTADIVWTLPAAGAMTVSFMSSTLATNMPEVVNSVTGGTNQLIFEGTADAFETILTATDCTTADATLTLPNDSGGVAYIPTGSTTKDATDAAIPLTHAVVIGTSDATSAWSLADGNPGQVLTVVIGTDGGEATITPASLTGCGWATVVLTDDVDGVTFMFVDATVGWVILGTFSDGTNIVAVTQ